MKELITLTCLLIFCYSLVLAQTDQTIEWVKVNGYKVSRGSFYTSNTQYTYKNSSIGGGDLFTSSDITDSNATRKYDVTGIKETSLLCAVSLTGGAVISSSGNVTGFVHEPLTAFPSTKIYFIGGYNNNSLAYAATNPDMLVRMANEGNFVYYSNDMGATWTASATNIKKADQFNFEIYPNPASDGKFTIALPEIANNLTVSIFNMQGKLVYQRDAGSPKLPDLDQQFNSGVYQVKVNTDKLNVTKKLIVKYKHGIEENRDRRLTV